MLFRSAIHAEMNALLQGSAHELEGATLYLYTEDAATGEIITASPCLMCKRAIVNAGISAVCCRTLDLNKKVLFSCLQEIPSQDWTL